ncbi:hypothetical protein OIU77_027804 [Salix suchowensis]|uniref:Uncharacterized protein n=1 Tax=Salix suchowensis TaxID=1278906 RepID=A0ABQ9BV93_9ROSI|nr:hypothetical protein OIU77_027804 [Salix suchowensis]
MATKNLIRAGASLMNRLMISKNPVFHQNEISTHQTLIPHLFPSSVSNFQQTDSLSITKLAAGKVKTSFILPVSPLSNSSCPKETHLLSLCSCFLRGRTSLVSSGARENTGSLHARQPRVVGE